MFICVHLHSINTLTHRFVLQCVKVPLIPAMSQAVLLSEAYGEKVASFFILISIITLWRASSYCCLPLSPALPPSASPCFHASDLASVCVFYWETQVRWDAVMHPTVTSMVQPPQPPFRCSWMMCLTPISPRGQQWLQSSNTLFQTCIYQQQAFSFREQRAVIIIRHLFCSATLPCCLHQNMSPCYINII